MRILLVEDDEKLNHSLVFQLEKEGFLADSCQDGEEALYYIRQNLYDLILLDRMLPHISGTEILNHMRKEQNQTPVILITALGTLEDKVTGLDLGADDYLVKPFAFEELMARIRTALRHSQTGASAKSQPLYHVGDLMIDFERRLVKVKDQDVHLTQIEYKLVSLLAQNAGRVLTYDYIINEIWGPYADSNNQILRVNMAHIRRKLEANPAEPQYIYTEIGVGYRMREE